MQDLLDYFIQNPTALYIAVGIFSLCIGSFLNVVIYRTPKMMEQEWRQDCQLLLHPEQAILDEKKLSLSQPASTCPQCKKPIRWYQNIPVISWLVLRGKCGTCSNPISIRYPLVELLTAICACHQLYKLRLWPQLHREPGPFAFKTLVCWPRSGQL